MARDEMAAVEAVQGKTDEKLGDDDDDDIRRISKFIHCHPTMKRLFHALENKITTINHKNNSKGGVDVADIINVHVGADSNAGNENVNDIVNGNVNDNDNGDVDDGDDDHDDDDDAHYRWLLQNEIDSTVDDFIQQIGTVVTRYETKFLPFFSGAEEAREFHPIPEGLRACRDTLMASIRANYATRAVSSSTMTVSECVRYMDTMAQTLVVKTWKEDWRWNGEGGQENVVTRERLDEFERGLDAAYDTEAQVQNMLRIFPNSIRDWPYDNYSGWPLVTDPRLISFLPIMLEAYIDDGKTIEETRNILISCDIVKNLFTTDSRIESTPLYDARCATVLRQLSKMNLLRKEDVKQYALLNTLLQGYPMIDQRQRFDFLVQLDPYALITQSNPYEVIHLPREIIPSIWDQDEIEPHGFRLPLRECAYPGGTPAHFISLFFPFIVNFEIVFEAMIRYFPNMKGICGLFQTTVSQNNEERSSPFKAACDQIQARMDALVRAMVDNQISVDTLFLLLRGSPDMLPTILSQNNNNQFLSTTRNQTACDLQTYGRDTTIGIVEKVLARNEKLISEVHQQTNLRNDAIVLAMIDKSVTLDGLFFLLRRSPNILSDVLLQPNCNELSSSSSRNAGMVDASSASTADSSNIRPQKKRKT